MKLLNANCSNADHPENLEESIDALF